MTSGENLPEKPCPARIKVIEGIDTTYEYCEQGPDGHDGTHFGERSRGEYLQLLKAWKASKQKGDE